MRRLLVLVLAACSAQPAVDIKLARCRTDLAPELAKLQVPGLAAGIIKHGELVCAASAGMANIAGQRPVTPDTLFLLASTSKTVTATALMLMVDDGKLQLDDAADAHLPFHVANPHCATTPITVRQLLTHTSSIDDNPALINCPGTCTYGSPMTSTVTHGADSPIALRDFVPGYLIPGGMYYDAKANFLTGCPGTTASYSNMGVSLAGYLAEVLAGQPLEQLTQDRIFAPLGMTETSWRLATIDPAHLAMPYDYAPATGFVPLGQFGEPDWPDGDLRSSVTELSRFLIMFMQLGEYGGHRILAESTVREMRRLQVPALDANQGLVWFYDWFPGGPSVLGHDGSDNGASTYMFFDPASGAGVILLSNGMWSDANDNSTAADALMATLFHEAADY